ncbi:MAG: hypothetical protein ACOYXR_05720 [Nitrospirota bacterium]
MKRDIPVRSTYHRSSAIGILTLLAVLILAPCLHAQGTEIVEPHAPASHASDRDPCCFDSYTHRFVESHPPCADAVTVARGALDRETTQPVTAAVPVPLSLQDWDQVDVDLTTPFREERGFKAQSASLYTLHRQYRL